MARRAPSLRLASYLRHIVEASARIDTYISALSEAEFLVSPMIQDAVIRNLEVIGEACRNVLVHHSQFAAEHDSVPWHAPYEMRNVLSHGYFKIDLVQVWSTLRGDLPAFNAKITSLLSVLDQGSPDSRLDEES